MRRVHGPWPSCLYTQEGFGRPLDFGRPNFADVGRPSAFRRPKGVASVESCRGLASWSRRCQTFVVFRTSEVGGPKFVGRLLHLETFCHGRFRIPKVVGRPTRQTSEVGRTSVVRCSASVLGHLRRVLCPVL